LQIGGGRKRCRDKKFFTTFCSSSRRFACVSWATKIVFGVTGRQKVRDSSANNVQTFLKADAFQLDRKAA